MTVNPSSRKKILLNASIIIKGGGIQAVVSFIRSLVSVRAQDPFDWHLVVSSVVAQQLQKSGVSLDADKDVVFERSPSKSRESRRRLVAFAKERGIDGVFTFFGPAYVKFPVFHMCGVADGWVTHSDFEAYSKIRSWPQRVTQLLLCAYKGVWFRRADAWFVEQEVAREGLWRRLRIPKKHVHVIANNCAEHYRRGDSSRLLKDDSTKILIFSSYYANKNLESIPGIAKCLQDMGWPTIEFVFTLEENGDGMEAIMRKASALGVASMIRNIGPVDLCDGPALYNSCHILLMPSVLETFSAVYPEAMSMGVPIVTADKPFSRFICTDAALYYDSDNPQQAAQAIVSLLTEEKLRQDLIAKGERRLQDFPSAQEKFEKLHALISSYVNP